MAKTSYKQTIKGSKDKASSHKRQAALLDDLIKARNRGRKNLSKQLRNANSRNQNNRKSIVKDLLNGFSTAKAGYGRSEVDNNANLGTVTEGSRLNRAREGTNAMAELSNFQVGETDRIKGMAASIRGLKANLDAGVNDYAAAITGISNSLGDLNSSVSTNINNALREENQQNASAYGEFTAGNQQAYADMVDLYGQQGSAYEQMADAMKDTTAVSKSSGTKNITSTQTDTSRYGKDAKNVLKKQKRANNKSADMAEKLAGAMGKTFTGKIMSIGQMNARETDPAMRFAAAEMKKNNSNLDDLANAGTLRKLAGPEGSKLRKKDVA